MGVAEREDKLDTELDESTDETDLESQDDPGEGEEGAEGSEGAEGAEGTEGEEDEDVVQIGEEEPPASEETKVAPQWVKDLRQSQRELRRENAELKAKLGAGQPGTTQAPTLPKKPSMSDPDIDYDEEKFQAATDVWYATKREIEAFEAQQQAAVDARQKAAQAVHENYAVSKKALKFKDFQEAEDEAVAVLDQVQQSILMAGATNPALMVYALGKNPKRLQALASIKDPVKFAVAVGELQKDVKVTKRTSTKPAPETTMRSNGSTKASTVTLDRLEAEAERTGDRSKVIAYKRQLKQQGQK